MLGSANITFHLNHLKDILSNIFKFIDIFIYTSFHEEAVNHSLLISGLKTYNIQGYIINIIQAIIVEIFHFPQYGTLSVLAVLCTGYQILAGFFLGGYL